MTDNEIKKALECCVNWETEGDCEKCPAYEKPFFCLKELRIQSLDLINRLKAENERLSKITRPLIAEIKAEAYTECIAKVKEKSKKTEIVCSGALVTMDYAISNKNLGKLLKELVGEDNESKT